MSIGSIQEHKIDIHLIITEELCKIMDNLPKCCQWADCANNLEVHNMKAALRSNIGKHVMIHPVPTMVAEAIKNKVGKLTEYLDEGMSFNEAASLAELISTI
jgi:hypothetical protein